MPLLSENIYDVPASRGADSLENVSSVFPTVMWQEVDSVAGDSVVSVSEVYGSGSYRAGEPEYSGRCPSAASGWGYQMLVVLLLLAYVVLALRYRREAAGPLSCVWGRVRDKGKRKEADMPPAGMQFLAVGCGVLMAGIGTVRLCELWGPAGMFSLASPGFGAWAALCLAVIWLTVIAVQQAFLKTAGSLTFRKDMAKRLTVLRFSFLLSLALTGTPCVLLMALAPEWWARIAAAVFAGVVILHAMIYVVRTFFLFIQQKVSILLWFLYLCAVEAMPPGIAVIGLIRSWPV